MKKLIKKLMYNGFPKILLRKAIIFESNPDMADSTYEIYKYMLDKNVNEKYKFIWFVSNKKQFKSIKIKNVKFINTSTKKNIIEVLRKKYYNYCAKIIVDSNRYVYKKNKYQKRIHLFHGVDFKKVPEYLNFCGECDYLISLKDIFNKSLSFDVRNPIDRFVNIGSARNDVLVKKTNKDIKKIFKLPKNSKVIVWLPTYRNHKNKNSSYHFEKKELGIPFINNEEEIVKINDILTKNNIYILFKPHPAEDLSILNNIELSNILILHDSDLAEKNILLYELLSKCDSLITDYSSVYFDYLLTERPIGLVFTDIKQYTKLFGFTCPDYNKATYGEKIYNYNDFKKYIIKVAEDKYDKKMYEKYKNIYHEYSDGKSTERLYDLIKKFL